MACYVGGTFAGQVMSAFRGGNVSSAPLDGVTVLLEAMRSHATNASIQTPSCGALWNLAYNADENKKKIAEAGGVSVLLDAIRSHPGNGGVQEVCNSCACYLLMPVPLLSHNGNGVALAYISFLGIHTQGQLASQGHVCHVLACLPCASMWRRRGMSAMRLQRASCPTRC